MAQVMSRTTRGLFQLRKANNDSVSAYPLIKAWAKDVLETTGITEIRCFGEAICTEPCLFLGNHMSYLDIPLLFTLMPAVFVAKKEVQDWPLFGRCATAAGTIFVDRGSMSSKRDVAKLIRSGIVDDKKSIVVFPEGTSSIHGKPWKRGAVGIAKENNITVQAFRVGYKPARDAAFIGDDNLTSHLWNLFGIEKIDASIEFFKPMKITDPGKDTELMQNWVQNSLVKELSDDLSY